MKTLKQAKIGQTVTLTRNLSELNGTSPTSYLLLEQTVSNIITIR